MTAEQLKASVLQMAIEGKLVPQLDDEPAVDIEAVEPEEVPFAIPEKWKWVTLEKLFNFVDYRGKTPIKSPSGVRLMTASNVRKGYIDHTRVEFISKEEFATRQSRGISAKGDILFTTEAPLGNAALADLEEYSAGQRVITLQSDTVNKQLYVYFLISPYFQKTLAENATGTTAQGIKAAKLKKLSLPLPPIAEQDRIVARLNEILPLIEEYGKAHSALKNTEQALPDQLRASLLQEAIQGKLVPQLDNEPAVDIAGEEPDEVPFAIPEKWRWVRIGDVVEQHLGGGTPSKAEPSYWGGNIPWASVKDMKGGRLGATEDFITEKGLANSASNLIPAGNLIVCMRMGLGKIAYNDIDVAINQDLRALFLRECISQEYFFYFYKSCQIIGSGVTVKGIKIGELLSMPIPLPPLAEQRRIVARLEELLPHVDAIAGLR